MTVSSDLVTVCDLVKEFDGRRVLHIPFLQFETGKVHVLTGHNGSGKTTLLRIIAGIERPTSGSIQIAEFAKPPGYCPQKPYMFCCTVKKNLSWGLSYVNIFEIMRIARQLQLEHIIDQPAKNCSAGEIQKISIGRMLLRKPSLLLLDEPTTNLDAQGVEFVENVINFFVNEGGTCIIATHIADQSKRFSARVVRLEQGCITYPEITNVFSGWIENVNSITKIRVNDKVSFFCSEKQVKGKHVRFCIPPTQIIISQSAISETFEQNSFPGFITALQKSNEKINLTVDIGLPLVVMMTPNNFFKVVLTIGTPVIVSFGKSVIKQL